MGYLVRVVAYRRFQTHRPRVPEFFVSIGNPVSRFLSLYRFKSLYENFRSGRTFNGYSHGDVHVVVPVDDDLFPTPTAAPEARRSSTLREVTSSSRCRRSRRTSCIRRRRPSSTSHAPTIYATPLAFRVRRLSMCAGFFVARNIAERRVAAGFRGIVGAGPPPSPPAAPARPSPAGGGR